jgi:hypothetical protein
MPNPSKFRTTSAVLETVITTSGFGEIYFLTLSIWTQTLTGRAAPHTLPSALVPSQVFLPVILLYPHFGQFAQFTS